MPSMLLDDLLAWDILTRTYPHFLYDVLDLRYIRHQLYYRALPTSSALSRVYRGLP